MDAFLRLEEYRKQAFFANIKTVRDKTLALLIKTVREVNPKTVLEIGTATGLSSIAMALAAPNACITTVEKDEERARVARENFRAFSLEGRVRLITADATDVIMNLTGTYDFIFLDGPKGQYYTYLPYLLSALSAGGVMVADDVAFHGYVSGEKTPNKPHKHDTIVRSLQNFLQYIENDKTLSLTVYDMEDGVVVIRKRV